MSPMCQATIERPCTSSKHICKTGDHDRRIIGCELVEMEPRDRPGNSSFMDTALARSTLGSTPGFIKATNERLRGKSFEAKELDSTLELS